MVMKLSGIAHAQSGGLPVSYKSMIIKTTTVLFISNLRQKLACYTYKLNGKAEENWFAATVNEFLE